MTHEQLVKRISDFDRMHPTPKKEYGEQKIVSAYLRKYHPDVEFRIDLAGSNMSIPTANKNKHVNKRRSWPDIYVFEPSSGCAGLMIELKKRGERLTMANDARLPNKETGTKRKRGDWKTEHLSRQAASSASLRKRGYLCCFGVGAVNTLKIIEGYMNNLPTLILEGVHPKEEVDVLCVLNKGVVFEKE